MPKKSPISVAFDIIYHLLLIRGIFEASLKKLGVTKNYYLYIYITIIIIIIKFLLQFLYYKLINFLLIFFNKINKIK